MNVYLVCETDTRTGDGGVSHGDEPLTYFGTGDVAGGTMSAPRVLVVGETTFPFHDIEEKRAQFEAALAEFDVTVTTDRSAVADLGPGDVLVDNAIVYARLPAAWRSQIDR